MSRRTKVGRGVDIDILEALEAVLHRIWIVFLVAVLCAGIGFAASRFLLPARYESRTSFYLQENGSTGTDIRQLTKDCAKLVTSRRVLEGAIGELGLEENWEDLAGKVHLRNEDDTHVLEIVVSDESPERAQLIANSVRGQAMAQIESVMQTSMIVVDEANLPTAPAGPNAVRYTLIFGLAGFAIAFLILLIRALLNDSIRNEQDVERYLGLSTLALIPGDDINFKADADAPKAKKKESSSRTRDAANMRSAERDLQRLEETGKLPKIPQEVLDRRVSLPDRDGEKMPSRGPKSAQEAYDEKALQRKRALEERPRRRKPAAEEPAAEKPEAPAAEPKEETPEMAERGSRRRGRGRRPDVETGQVTRRPRRKPAAAVEADSEDIDLEKELAKAVEELQAQDMMEKDLRAENEPKEKPEAEAVQETAAAEAPAEPEEQAPAQEPAPETAGGEDDGFLDDDEEGGAWPSMEGFGEADAAQEPESAESARPAPRRRPGSDTMNFARIEEEDGTDLSLLSADDASDF